MKKIWTSHEDGPELGQQPTNSRNQYDAYRRSHDGTRTTHEGNTKMWICNKKCTRRPHEGNTMVTRRRIEGTMRSNEVTKSVMWPPDGIKPSTDGGKFNCWSEIKDAQCRGVGATSKWGDGTNTKGHFLAKRAPTKGNLKSKIYNL